MCFLTPTQILRFGQSSFESPTFLLSLPGEALKRFNAWPPCPLCPSASQVTIARRGDTLLDQLLYEWKLRFGQGFDH